MKREKTPSKPLLKVKITGLLQGHGARRFTLCGSDVTFCGVILSEAKDEKPGEMLFCIATVFFLW